MSTKEKIIHNLSDIKSQNVLNEILDFVKQVKTSFSISEKKQDFMSFAGTLTEQEADEMQASINQEFSHIEGNWE